MTVHELIQKLSEFDSDEEVQILGLNDIHLVARVEKNDSAPLLVFK